MIGRRVAALLLGTALCLTGTPGWGHEGPHGAEEPGQLETFMRRHNVYSAFDKLGRGAANTLGGWMEIPLNAGKRYSTVDTAGSFLAGIGVGLFKGVARTGVGLYEVVTFWLPLPEHYRPILPTLEYFRKRPDREYLPLE